MAQNETSPFAPIFFLAYKKESIDYFSSVSSSSIQHYLRKKINKTGRNHLERILEAFRRHLEGMRGRAPLNKNWQMIKGASPALSKRRGGQTACVSCSKSSILKTQSSKLLVCFRLFVNLRASREFTGTRHARCSCIAIEDCRLKIE